MKVNRILIILLISLSISCPIFGAIEDHSWVKSEGSVLGLGGVGGWEDGRLQYPVIVKYEGYEMWYLGCHLGTCPGCQVSGYAASSDGFSWIKYENNPVLNAASGWEYYSVYASSIIRNVSTYSLWYCGYDGGYNTGIGYATSTDGKTWNKNSGNPVLTRGSPGEWDDRFIMDASVIKDGDTYKMWYFGAAPLNAGSPQSAGIGYATSPDGINWTKYQSNPVFPADVRTTRPSVIKDGSEYIMFYDCPSSMNVGWAICYANSSDGISWNPSVKNPILTQGTAGAWDEAGVKMPSAIKDGNTYKIWFVGVDANGNERIGYAYTNSSQTCPSGPEQKMLEKISNFPWDYYTQYQSYDNDAVKPESPPTCYLDLNDSSAWLARDFSDRLAYYPFEFSVFGRTIGYDFNTWYEGDTAVVTQIPKTGKNISFTYPEGLFSAQKALKKVPFLGSSSSLVQNTLDLLDIFEASLNTGGMSYQGKIRKLGDDKAEISGKFNASVITPGVKADLLCDTELSRDYYAHNDSFGNGTVEELGCFGSMGLNSAKITYEHDDSLDLGLIKFNGVFSTVASIKPKLDAGVNLRPLPPAYVTGLRGEGSVDAKASAIGELCQGKTCKTINQTFDALRTSNITLIGESAAALINLTEGQNVNSLFPRVSDGKKIEYAELKSLSPVFRLEGSEITAYGTLCLNLSDMNIPCGLFFSCSQCLYKGKIFTVPSWEKYSGETVITVHSPVEVHAYDELGNHIGKNGSGQVEYNIPESNYSESSDSKTIGFTTSTDNFLVLLNGTGTGTYNLDINRPVMINLPNGSVIIREITYKKIGVFTELGRVDSYGFNFADIERMINDLVAGGMEIPQAIEAAFEVEVNLGASKFPTIIGSQSYYATSGEPVIINTTLYSTRGLVSGAQISFSLDGGLIGTNSTNSNGEALLYYSPSILPSVGKHNLTITYLGDDSYLESNIKPILEILQKPFVASISAPEYANGTVKITGSLSGSTPSGTTLMIDDLPISSGLSYDWNTSLWADGLHKVSINATAHDGLEAYAAKLVYVDNNAPLIRVSGVENGKIYNISVYPVIEINESWLVSSKIELDGSSFVNGSEVSLEGGHNLNISATDQFNQTTQLNLNFTMDKTAPVITINSPINNTTYARPVYLDYLILDNLDKAPLVQSNYPNATLFNKEGNYTFSISAEDNAGNRAAKTINFTVDYECVNNSECSSAKFCNSTYQCQQAFQILAGYQTMAICKAGCGVLFITERPLSRVKFASMSVELFKNDSKLGEYRPVLCYPEFGTGQECMYQFMYLPLGTYRVDVRINGDLAKRGAISFSVPAAKLK